jgi:NitT/TauT family transport system ATP-binding protein
MTTPLDHEPHTLPHISCAAVTKRYGAATILDNISLDIAKGDFVSLIGPSGCGKSTLLKLISGLIPATSGQISVDGMTPQNARELISFIFQDATLLPWRTVERNVSLCLELDRIARSRRTEKTAELLSLVGLTHVARSYPRQLSGGMKMRVSIARALASKPQLLLMDEPFAALDEITRDRMNEELIRLREEQKWTGVFVTHSVAEAVFLSSRIIILSAHPGRIARDLPIPLPYPRTAATRAGKDFEALVSQVSRALREGIQAEGIQPEGIQEAVLP